MSQVVDRAEGAIPVPGRPSDWVAAQRGPVTFSLPELMSNVQVWGDAAELRSPTSLARKRLAAARARPKANTDQVSTPPNSGSEAIQRILTEIEQAHAKKTSPPQFWLFVAAYMAGFMVKVPIWPFHTWLPGAYGEAPTGVVVLLSAVMAKLGTFGILRLVLPLVPDAAACGTDCPRSGCWPRSASCTRRRCCTRPRT